MSVKETHHLFFLKWPLRGMFTHRKDNFIACFLLCFVLIVVTGCISSQQRRVNEAAEEIYQSLYVPVDAIILGKVENDHLLAYASGCTGTVIEAAYGVNRPLTEVIEEYHQPLLRSGWELYPGYDQEERDNYVVYRKGPMAKLSIGSYPVDITIPTPGPGEKAFSTIYAIDIVFTMPSNADCIG